MNDYSVIDTVKAWQIERDDVTVFGKVVAVDTDGYDVSFLFEDEDEWVTFASETVFELYAIVYDVTV